MNSTSSAREEVHYPCSREGAYNRHSRGYACLLASVKQMSVQRVGSYLPSGHSRIQGSSVFWTLCVLP